MLQSVIDSESGYYSLKAMKQSVLKLLFVSDVSDNYQELCDYLLNNNKNDLQFFQYSSGTLRLIDLQSDLRYDLYWLYLRSFKNIENLIIENIKFNAIYANLLQFNLKYFYNLKCVKLKNLNIKPNYFSIFFSSPNLQCIEIENIDFMKIDFAWFTEAFKEKEIIKLKLIDVFPYFVHDFRRFVSLLASKHLKTLEILNMLSPENVKIIGKSLELFENLETLVLRIFDTFESYKNEISDIVKRLCNPLNKFSNLKIADYMWNISELEKNEKSLQFNEKNIIPLDLVIYLNLLENGFLKNIEKIDLSFIEISQSHITILNKIAAFSNINKIILYNAGLSKANITEFDDNVRKKIWI